jgi:hypothetical protein
MKFIICIIIFCFLLCSNSQAQVKLTNRAVKVLESTFQSWSPGAMPQGQSKGGGIIYTIKLVVLSKSSLIADSLIIDNARYPVEVIKGTDRNYKSAFAYKDTLVLIGRKDYSAQLNRVSSRLMKVIAKNKYAGYLLFRNSTKPCLVGISSFTEQKQRVRNN